MDDEVLNRLWKMLLDETDEKRFHNIAAVYLFNQKYYRDGKKLLGRVTSGDKKE